MTSSEHLGFGQTRQDPGQETPVNDFSGQSADQPADQPARPTAADRFFGSIRRTGLVRSHDRWVAGVAGGIARRTGVHVNAVRAGFVVLALVGGIGLGLYGLAWALLPDVTGRIEAQAAQRGDVSAALVLAVGLVVLDLVLGNGLLGLGWVL
ncbi:PspC domain-containing protein [Kineococcus sp. TBRC 1896]|uniref:PspC domain-containing protein n=1 Tax=Kineococcus mangrovi TaxID=1660183 RepID=A0ABV4I614_9ACTN